MNNGIDVWKIRKQAKMHAKKIIFSNIFLTIGISFAMIMPFALVHFILTLSLFGDISTSLAVYCLLFWSAIQFLAVPPLLFGKYSAYLKIIANAHISFFDVFEYLSSIKKYWLSIKMAFVLNLLSFFWFVVLLAPISIAGYYFRNTPELESILSFFTIFFMIMFFIKQQVISANYIFNIISKKSSVLRTLALTRSVLKNKFFIIGNFYVSFAGWMALSAMTGGLISIYYTLYYDLSYICFLNMMNIQKNLIQALGQECITFDSYENAPGDPEQQIDNSKDD